MARRRCRPTRPGTRPTLPPDAAGGDLGATAIDVCVPRARAPEPLRRSGTFSEDRHTVADWLRQCRGTAVAMEATGVYGIPLSQSRETRGVAVCLVNARHGPQAPGRTSDVQDCQWLQALDAVGLLRASFRPPDAVCAVRTLLRHRDSLVPRAAAHPQHMQTARTQLNRQLQPVLRDLTRVTGLAILDAILDGERDPQGLAQPRDRRIKASPETLAQARVGDYRSEHLFPRRQSLAADRQPQDLIAACDREVPQRRGGFAAPIAPAQHPRPETPKARRTPRGRSSLPGFELRPARYRLLGTALARVPGLPTPSVFTLFAELGAALAAFPAGGHFASGLGLCPANRISRRQGLVRQDPARHAPRGRGPADGGAAPLPPPVRARGLLPPAARQAGRPGSHHRHRAQAGPDHLPPSSPRLHPLPRPGSPRPTGTISTALSHGSGHKPGHLGFNSCH